MIKNARWSDETPQGVVFIAAGAFERASQTRGTNPSLYTNTKKPKPNPKGKGKGC